MTRDEAARTIKKQILNSPSGIGSQFGPNGATEFAWGVVIALEALRIMVFETETDMSEPSTPVDTGRIQAGNSVIRG